MTTGLLFPTTEASTASKPVRAFTHGAILRTFLPALLLLSGCQGGGDLLSVAEWESRPGGNGSDSILAGKAPSAEGRLDTFRIDNKTRVIGHIRRVKARENDTLLDIARHFDIGYEEMVNANPGVDPWLPRAGTEVVVPSLYIIPDAPQNGLVLNLAALRLFYFPPVKKGHPRTVITYPVGIGREGWQTPLGATTVVTKVKAPKWVVPPSIRAEHAQEGDPLPEVVLPGPDNPLGKYAFRLGLPSYLIHGTNKPAGIGMRVSHGCIQLLPEDIESLFKRLPVGTQVRIVNQPYLAAMRDGILYFQAHTPLEEDRRTLTKNSKPARMAVQKALRAAGTQLNVDWVRIKALAKVGHGVPTPVTSGSADYAMMVAASPEVKLPDTPHHGQIAESGKKSGWYVQAGSFRHEGNARKLAAMISHMNSTMPARYVESGERHQVVAGPFRTRQQAIVNAHRIKSNFGTQAVVLRPGT